MDPKYAAWLKDHKPTDELKGRGQCLNLSRSMASAFQELRVAAGYYHCPLWGKQQHWWCVTPEGEILDPTACQFPSKGIGWYQELKVEERPVGRCMDCGEDVFRLDKDGNPNKYAPTFCNEKCWRATERYLNTGVL